MASNRRNVDPSYYRKLARLPKVFNYQELVNATDNFSKKLGGGLSGAVFEGKLNDGTPVAVKKVERSEYGKIFFEAEVSTIANLQHKHLVHLQGFCSHEIETGGESYVVYDLLRNGSLDSWIFQKSGRPVEHFLSWKLRYQVAMDVAKALIYLHEDCCPPIIHIDVKPANVLLDDNFRGVLADFGLSVVTKKDGSHAHSFVGRGTRGYIAPEMVENNQVSFKSDMYSFGRLLLDMFFGQIYVCLDINGTDIYKEEGNSLSEQRTFHAFMQKKLEKKDIVHLADKRLTKNMNEEEANTLIGVALCCTEEDPRIRPCDMRKVLQLLEQRQQDQDECLQSNSQQAVHILKAQMQKPHIKKAALPTFVVFKSVYNEKYLRLTNGKDEGLPIGFVKFDEEEVVNPAIKFELETPKDTEAKQEGLVHIRSCYNNKYLVRNFTGMEDNCWIVAGAKQPEENQSKSSCTLFKPEPNHSNYGFRHIQLRRFACMWMNDFQGMYLGSESPDEDLCHLYTLVNWENLVLFPLRVAFKGDNGKYLSSRNVERHPYHQFAENTRDETGEYEVTMTGNGCVRIKSIWNGKFWRRSPNWIWADSSNNSPNNPDELFWPVKLRDNVVALRNMGNNYYCKRLTTEGKTNCLNAGTPSIGPTAELVVEEVIMSRKILNIDFRLSDARVYGENLIALATGGASNESYGTESKYLSLKLVYKNIKTQTWNNSISLKLGSKATVQVHAIPLIVEGKVELSAETSATYQWGETYTTETDVETSYTVNIPPRTKTTVTLKAIQASCDVLTCILRATFIQMGKISSKPCEMEFSLGPIILTSSLRRYRKSSRSM